MDLENVMAKLKGSVREVPDESLEIPDDLSGLDEAGDLLTPDPPAARRSGKAPARKAPAKPTKAVQTQVADALTMMITLPAGILAFRDPLCAGAVLDHADNVVAKLVPIVCRNPTMLRWFTEGGGYMDWFGLAWALMPIAKTVWSHHVTHTVGLDEEEDEFVDYARYSAPPVSS